MNEVSHDFLTQNSKLKSNATRTLWVIIISFLTMVVEIAYGMITGSMALLADGWHMASHVLALMVTYLAYRLACHPKWASKFNFGGGKIIPLGGYTSSLILLIVAVTMAYESFERWMDPKPILFNEAIFVCLIGLLVNFLCAFILRGHDHMHSHGCGHNHGGHSHGHDHSHEKNDPVKGKHAFINVSGKSEQKHDHHVDHNMRGAYMHVLADALTSIAALVALILGKLYGWNFLDPLIGGIASLIILKWAIGLIKDTGWELMDGHAQGTDYDKVKARIESEGVQILDLHIWKIAPGTLACELVVISKHTKGLAHFKKILSDFQISHVVVEERLD